jgi:hypothetical protein
MQSQAIKWWSFWTIRTLKLFVFLYQVLVTENIFQAAVIHEEV